MFGIQEKFDNEISNYIKTNQIVVLSLDILIQEKTGIILTDTQKDLFADQLQPPISNLTFDFSDEQLIAAGYKNEKEVEHLIHEVVQELPNKVSFMNSNLDEVMESVIANSTDQIAEEIVEDLFSNFEEMIGDKRENLEKVSEYIHSIWGEPLDFFQGLISILDETIDAFFKKYPNLYDQNIAVEALLRIHAKANQIAKEILVLMRNGFADGAQARWRTLHELAVISHFISEHGNECAERYLDHDIVEEYKYALQHNEYCERLGYSPYSAEDLADIEVEYNRLLKKYGQNFRFDFGWASEALSCKKPNFRDIELSVELDHHRPLFKSASANIHANSTGVIWRLGTNNESDLLLAGPSEIGIETPASYSTASMIQIATALLNFNPTMDGIVGSKILNKYGDIVDESFYKVADSIETS
ncbi:DUF5677 domain-containing protein [Vibrio coralliilyticus]|uniref:DUF5677 domain-containing protein n=1 Tax=Vibrio coralliilyticus TaxID=190893 RepID=UPI00148BE7A8|nr:DUF5677 domain-containing protein [Vibrio coralliilyticus]NOI32212.1 hypothetical protein [Vibrio coralliilyticus]NOI51383.1 hypothetical protein [Vibrio coralliilyticus]